MSTLKVNAIEPYSGGTVTITGGTIDSASYAENANALTPGDKVLSGSISFEHGKGINLQEYSFGAGQTPSYIRFYSGSTQGANYINMQNEPNGNGRVTISAFPANDHFFFLDPNTHTTEFDGTISGYAGNPLNIEGNFLLNNGTAVFNNFTTNPGYHSLFGIDNTAGGGGTREVLTIVNDQAAPFLGGANIIVDGTSLFKNNVTVTGSLSVSGQTYANDIVNVNANGGGVARVTLEDYFSDYYGGSWWRDTNNKFTNLIFGAEASTVLALNTWSGSYDNNFEIQVDNVGAKFSDWNPGAGYAKDLWLVVPQLEKPAFQRGLIVTGSATFDSTITGSVSTAYNNNVSSGSIGFWQGTQAEYNLISASASPDIIYFVV